jgi:cytochrome P450
MMSTTADADDQADGVDEPGPTFTPRRGEGWRDPFGMYEALRDKDPLHHVAHGDYWVLSRFDDVWAAARDTATFSSADGLTTSSGEREKIGLDEARPIVMMDPPEHTAFRRLISRGFSPRQVAEIEPEIRRFVVDRLVRLDGVERADIVAELFKPLPSMVVAHYLGVPPDDRERFDGWTEAIVDANAYGDVMSAAERMDELLEYFAGLIERRRSEPGDDMISALVHATMSSDAGAVGDGVALVRILGFAFTMVAGGNDTTTGLLGGGAELLTRHRDQRQLLLDDPALVPGVVDELLRLVAPVQGLARTTTEPVEMHGRTIPAGRKVLLLYASANRDPREYGPSADRLDVTRTVDRMMSFSYGAHHCIGAAAARLQGRVVLDELLARFPAFEVDAAGGTFATGNYVRRYASLPFHPKGA